MKPKTITKYVKIVKDKPYGHVIRRIYISKANLKVLSENSDEGNLPAELEVKITIQTIKNNKYRIIKQSV